MWILSRLNWLRTVTLCQRLKIFGPSNAEADANRQRAVITRMVCASGDVNVGGDAIALIETDGPVSDQVADQVRGLPNVVSVKPLVF